MPRTVLSARFTNQETEAQRLVSGEAGLHSDSGSLVTATVSRAGRSCPVMTSQVPSQALSFLLSSHSGETEAGEVI